MRSPSLVGQMLGGRYLLGELLGEGGWGAVYAATQVDLGRPVAIKLLRAEASAEPELLARFEREAKAAAGLGHPNIAQVTELHVRPGEAPFLVMERLVGQTFGSAIRAAGRLPPPRVAWIAHQVLAALDAAHAAGIIHRDVKPENIFLVSAPGVDDFAKLLDFGIAKLADKGAPQLTQGETMLGSPAYMAPEQVRGAALDHRVDLYAVGATMYHALAGRYPHDAPNLHALLLAITDQRVTPLAAVDRAFDPALSAFVDRALAKDPAARFGSAAEMRAALDPFLAPAARARGGAPVSTFAQSLGAPAGVAPAASAPPANGPYGPPPTPYGAPPPMYGAPAVGVTPMLPAQTPIQPGPATQKGGSGAIVALLAVIVLLLLVGLGGGGWLLLRDRDAAPSAGAPGSAAAPVVTTPPAATTNAAAPATVAAAPHAKPGAPAAPATVAPAVVVADAGAAPASGKKMGGRSASLSLIEADTFQIDDVKNAVGGVMGGINACYAASELDPPEHTLMCWFLPVDASGHAGTIQPVTEFSQHPKLVPCVAGALRGAKFPPKAGKPKLCFASRIAG